MHLTQIGCIGQSSCLEPLQANRSETQSGKRPYLTLYISTVKSYNSLLYIEKVNHVLKVFHMYPNVICILRILSHANIPINKYVHLGL